LSRLFETGYIIRLMAKTRNSEPVLRVSAIWRPVTPADIKRARRVRGWRMPELRRRAGVLLGEALDASMWIETPLDGRWRACYRVLVQGQRYAIAEVRVCPIEPLTVPGEWSGAIFGASAVAPVGGIPAAVFAKLRNRATLRAVEAIVKGMQARLQLAKPRRDVAPYRGEDRTSRALLQDALPSRRRRGRPAAVAPGGFTRFAERFVQIEEARVELEDMRRSTRKELAREYGVPETRIKRWISICRDRGLLQKTRRGQRGGRRIAP
jgi:hypothetical protein